MTMHPGLVVLAAVPVAPAGGASSADWSGLLALAAGVLQAAMVAFGGLGVVLGPLSRNVVDLGLMSPSEFARQYALASFAPGPNGPVFLSLLGWGDFGFPGVVIVMTAWALPSLLITHQLGRMSQTGRGTSLQILLSILKAAAVGLVLDGVLAMLSGFDLAVPTTAILQGGIAFAGIVLLIRYQLNPLWVLLGSMALGALVL